MQEWRKSEIQLRHLQKIILWKVAMMKLEVNNVWASLIAQLVKNSPAMQETLVRLLGQEYPLEKRKSTHSCMLGFSW